MSSRMLRSNRSPRSVPAFSLRPLAAVAAALGAPLLAFAQAPAVQLGEVVVSASGFEQELSQAPASITVVHRGELETKRSSSLAEALADVEGVDVGDSAGKTGGLNISIRGMPSDYTLILVDGRRQNAAGNITPNGFGETSTSFLPPISAIERIEVIRGPMSTLYGSDAMGGVVNIITRKVAKQWTGSASVNGTVQSESDRGGNYGANVYLSGPIKEDLLGMTIRASTFKREASELHATGEAADTIISTRGPSAVKGETHTLGTRLTLLPTAGHELYLDLDTSRQKYDNSTGQLGTLGVQGYSPEMRFNRDQAVLAYNAQLGGGKLETALTRNTTETIGRTIPNGTPGKQPGSARDLESTNTIVDAKYITAIGDSHLATFGGQFWDAKMTDGVAPAPYEHKQWALFGEDEWQILPSTTLTLGARYDHHNRFGGNFSPRAYAVWNATEQWTVKGGVSKGFKTPRLDQLASGITGFTAQGTRPTIGTPTLKPETSTSFELGSVYDNKQGTSFGGTVFLNKFKDKIADGPGLLNCSWAAEPNRPGCVDYGNWSAVDTYAQSVNVDRAETKGFELNARTPLTKTVSVLANYTFTRSVQKSGADAGNPLYNTPKHMFNAKLDWKATPELTTWARAEYRSTRFREDDLIRSQLGDYRAYTQFHIGGTYRVNKQVSINAAIYNLFNKDFLSYSNYTNAAGKKVAAGLYANPQEGRRLWISANVEF